MSLNAVFLSNTGRLKPQVWFWGMVFGLVLANQAWWPTPVEANNAEFDPGNIISDQVMSASTTMTANQIQAFLEERVKGGACDRHRESERAQGRGFSPPWTCLAEFQQNPQTGATNYGQFDPNGQPTAIDGGLTAAEIIHQAGQRHRINPQVLLVILQKQQGLVTDNWPWPVQFSLATGLHCRADSPCGTDATDFYRQIEGMAQELRQKLDGQRAIPHQVGLNQIPYNPDISCGTASIQIANQATAVIYSLEPYVPNPTALVNLQGNGDDCSAYGNRNFWVQFLTWFGPSTTSTESSPPASPGSTSSLEVGVFRGHRFDPGNIISDQVMSASTTMTANQIQAFLEERVKGGACDRHRESERAQGRGFSPPWTCLAEFQQNPQTGATNYGQFDPNGQPTAIDGGLTAAEIIHQAGQRHQINPQVLLVILQKEQELVTDNWPWPVRYAKATGWDCPDGGSCNPETADFYQQVDSAARGLRGYIDNLESWWYRVGLNQIRYHPNHSCGYQTVDIKNRATAALYLYTPYVPNTTALVNLHGTGDDCSAYGNRNFWVLFLSWFGNPTELAGTASSRAANPVSESAPTSFTPGNIISDPVIRRVGTMTAGQIQAFLDQQLVPDDCNRQQASGPARRRGFSPPWTCLAEFQQNPQTGATNYGQFDPNGQPTAIDGGLTAAKIIQRAAQSYQINPQVLLVMLELNHRLVTDDWPWPIQFDKAGNWTCRQTGCPAGPAGFSQQVNGLAHQLRTWLDNPSQSRYRAGRQTIAHHPDPTCGLGMVMIRNQATAAIYNQYPYLPNQSVVTNYPQAGDDCSSYQLRNFWRLFKDWFKTTH